MDEKAFSNLSVQGAMIRKRLSFSVLRLAFILTVFCEGSEERLTWRSGWTNRLVVAHIVSVAKNSLLVVWLSRLSSYESLQEMVDRYSVSTEG